MKVKIRESKLEDIKERKIWVPYMCDNAFIVASIFRRIGYEAGVLPRSNDPLLSLGRKYTDGDQCLPSIITTEDILKRVYSPDFNPDKEAFFQGKSEGPCRFGRYYMNQRIILDELGFDNVPIFTLDNRNNYEGLGAHIKLAGFTNLMSQSLLERKLHFTRPLEVTKGEAEKTYQKYLGKVCNEVEKGKDKGFLLNHIGIIMNKHKEGLIKILKEANEEFSRIKKREEEKPVIFVTGEIYVRNSSVANQNLIKKIEDLGGIALLEPSIAFFLNVNQIKVINYEKEFRSHNLKSIFDWMKCKVQQRVLDREEHDLSDILGFPPDPKAREVVERGSSYVHPSYKGEAIVTLGGSEYFASQNNMIQGIVNAIPFNCMPGLIVVSKSNELRKSYNNLPFLNLSYDGHMNKARDEQLEVFMYQVKERFRNLKPAPAKCL